MGRSLGFSESALFRTCIVDCGLGGHGTFAALTDAEQLEIWKFGKMENRKNEKL